MNELLISALGCLVVGLMSTLHPCPLATNMAAVSMIVGSSGKRCSFILGVAFFTAGYMISMICLSLVINISLFAIPKISLFLQGVISLFLGPVLILTGMFTSGLLKFDQWQAFRFNSSSVGQRSYIYLFSLGLLLALAFCPATASLYFGILIPLSIKFDQVYLFPLLYAFGAVVPIAGSAYLIKTGSERIIRGKWTKSITKVAGYLLIIIGIYISVQRLYLA